MAQEQPSSRKEPRGCFTRVLIQIIITIGTIAVAYFQFALPVLTRKAQDAGESAAKPAANQALIDRIGEIDKLKADQAALAGGIIELKKAVGIVTNPPEAIVVGDLLQNVSNRPIIVTMGCNATGREAKQVSGYASPSKASGLDGNSFQVSVSGGDQLSATYVVPPNWFYKVVHTGAGGCKFRSWPI